MICEVVTKHYLDFKNDLYMQKYGQKKKNSGLSFHCMQTELVDTNV